MDVHRIIARETRRILAMSSEARELELWIENDGDLYRGMHLPIIENLMRRWRKGTYDHNKAVKAFLNLADEGAKSYVEEFGSPDSAWHEIFPKSARLEVAESMRDHFEAEAELGNYDRL